MWWKLGHVLVKTMGCDYLSVPKSHISNDRERGSNSHHGITPVSTWWRHQMETFSALLAICAGNSPVPGEFPTQRPVTRSLDVYFDLRPNKRLSKQWWGWWFETQSCPLWHHCNEETADIGSWSQLLTVYIIWTKPKGAYFIYCTI